MEIKKEIVINRPADEVWEVLGNQFSAAHKWARSLKHSEGYGEPQLQHAHCNNRACDTTQGKIKEVIKSFDPNHYKLSYEVIEGFPFFVKSGVNTWQLTPQGSTTKVNVHLVIQTGGIFGMVMAPMMKIQMNSLLEGVMQDLKHYVEMGKPSPTKAKELAKFAVA